MSNKSAEGLDERWAPHLEYFADRSNLLFSYHFFMLEFRDDEELHKGVTESDRAWMLKTMQNACLNTTLIALRDLDDFFNPRKAKPSDLRASDFGMSQKLRFLTRDERTQINELIAHMTFAGAPGAEHRWDLEELISKALAQCDTFFEWIQNNMSLRLFSTWTAAVAAQAKTKAIWKTIQEELGQ